MIHIHRTANLFSGSESRPPGEGWETVSVDEFNALRAAGWLPRQPYQQDTDIILQRLSAGERAALFAARQANWQIDYLVTRAAATGSIREDDPDFPAARAALDQLGIIAAARWDALFAP
ncbi:MAG: hypothetical protein HZC55_04075 [Verrucomicrobia bacterium]|nr:hypothetical protein [Verrucomicrobiota bacterium]